MKRHTAFSLIELLVVIAIISVLVGIMLPGLNKAKEKARQAQCRGNLRQIGLGLMMYAQDYERYPYLLTYLVSRSEFYGFDRPLEPYTQGNWTNVLYRCPSYRGRTILREKTPTGGLSNPEGSYGYNAWGTSLGGNLTNRLGLGGSLIVGPFPYDSGTTKEVEVRVPSEMLAIGDASAPTDDYKVRAVKGTLQPPTSSWPYPIHWPGMNFALCDGHVEFGKVVRIFERTESARLRWNYDNKPHSETWKD